MSQSAARMDPRGTIYSCTPESQSTSSLAIISTPSSPEGKNNTGSSGFLRPPSEPIEDSASPGLLYGKVPTNYTVAAWVSCVFGFFPIGIVAVVFSYKARKALGDLNMQAAHHFTKRAKYYAKMSVYTGVLLAVVIILGLRTAWSMGAI